MNITKIRAALERAVTSHTPEDCSAYVAARKPLDQAFEDAQRGHRSHRLDPFDLVYATIEADKQNPSGNAVLRIMGRSEHCTPGPHPRTVATAVRVDGVWYFVSIDRVHTVYCNPAYTQLKE